MPQEENLHNLYLLRRLDGDRSKFEYLQMVLGTGANHVVWTENAKEAAHFCDAEVARNVSGHLGAYNVFTTVVVSQRSWTL